MGYRFDCDPVVVGKESHEFLHHLAWAAQLPAVARVEEGWSYDCSGWKRPHRAIPLVMAVGVLHRDLKTLEVQIRGEDENDIQDFAFDGQELAGPGFAVQVTWDWLAQCIRSLRSHPYWEPSKPLKRLPSDQSMYAGYGPAKAEALLEALRPWLLASVLGKEPERDWGPDPAGAAFSAVERYNLRGATLQECEEGYFASRSALVARGIEMPATLGDLLAGFSRFPASW